MHRIVRSEPKIMDAAPSGHKGYLVLSRHSSGDWYVTVSPFKEVPVYEDVKTAIQSADDGEYVIEIDLPRTD